MVRLERLRAAARATGVLTADEVGARIDPLENDLQQLAVGEPPAVTSEDVGRRLAALGDRIDEALRTTGERKAVLERLSALPAQFLVSQAEGRLDHPNLVRLRSVMSDAQARLDLASPLVGTTGAAVTAQNATIATIDQNIAVLDAARTDFARRAHLAELISSEQQDRASLNAVIAAHRVTIVEADAAISQHSEASAEVARLRSLAASARRLNGRWRIASTSKPRPALPMPHWCRDARPPCGPSPNLSHSKRSSPISTARLPMPNVNAPRHTAMLQRSARLCLSLLAKSIRTTPTARCAGRRSNRAHSKCLPMLQRWAVTIASRKPMTH